MTVTGKGIENLARQIARDLPAQLQPRFDRVFDSREGKTVTELADELQAACPELQPAEGPEGFNEWARLMFEGQRVVLTPGDPSGI